MNFKGLKTSFVNAGKGVKYVFKHEQNFRIQIFISILVILLAWFVDVSRAEWVLLILIMLAIMSLELINSAVEKFSDVIKPRLSDQVKIIKDIMAAVVLLASLGSIIIGLIIFWPHLVALFF